MQVMQHATENRPCTAGRGMDDAWDMSVREQLGGSLTAHIEGLSDDTKKENRRYWKSRIEYGQRWIVEIIISAFKRLFGNSVSARKWENIVQEIKLKIAIYNRYQEVLAMQ